MPFLACSSGNSCWAASDSQNCVLTSAERHFIPGNVLLYTENISFRCNTHLGICAYANTHYFEPLLFGICDHLTFNKTKQNKPRVSIFICLHYVIRVCVP
jgi:hypothetical protein